MKTNQLFISTFFCCSLIAFAACSKDEENPKEDTLLPDKIIENTIYINGTGSLAAPVQRYYSLENGSEIAGTMINNSNWDISFKRSEIFINSGTSGGGNVTAQALDKLYNEVTTAPESGYLKDGEGEKDVDTGRKSPFSNWYNYDLSTLQITPKEQTYIILTNNKKYVKLKIDNYSAGKYNLTYKIQTSGSKNLSE